MKVLLVVILAFWLIAFVNVCNDIATDRLRRSDDFVLVSGVLVALRRLLLSRERVFAVLLIEAPCRS